MDHKTTKPATFLIKDPSPDFAQHALSLLRNRGLAVHTRHVQTVEELARLLEPDTPAVLVTAAEGRIDEPHQVRKLLATHPATALIVRLLPPVSLEMLGAVFEATPDGVIDCDDDDQLAALAGRLLDRCNRLTALQSDAARLRELEERYNLLLDSSREAIAYIHEGLHIYANSAYIELFGYQYFSDLEGVSIIELLEPAADGGDLKLLLRHLDQGLLPPAQNFVARRGAGDKFNVTVDFSPARYGGESCVQMLVREVRQEIDPQLHQELDRLRNTDLLTGMLNRQAFMQHLAQHLHALGKEVAAGLLLVEVDRFDRLMERLGVNAADAMVAEIASLLQRLLNAEHDLICRYGDHTFTFFVIRERREDIAALAESLVAAIAAEPLELQDSSVAVTVSVGLSPLGEMNRDPEVLIGQAIGAWQDAVAAGGNRVERYRPRLVVGGDQTERDQWLTRLGHAVDNNELKTAGAPVTNIDNDREQIVFHRLVWEAAEGDQRSGEDSFIASVRHSPLATRLDQLRIAEVLTHGEPRAVHLLRLSADTLRDPNFPAWLRGRQLDAKVALAQIVLLIDGDDLSTDLRHAKNLIEDLGPEGLNFGIDRYGASDEIRRLAEHLPVLWWRLDPKLTERLNDAAQLDRLKNIAQSARQAKIRAVATGISGATAMAQLWQHGIALVEGTAAV